MKLITTITEVQKHIPVSMTSHISTIAPFLANAERLYVLQIIGAAQFDIFVQAYTTATKNLENIVDLEIKEAISICQKIVSNFGYYQATPILAVSVGTSGIQVNSNENTKQAFQWQVEDLKDSLLELGYSAIEELLIFLEENPDKFSAFIDSPEHVKQETYLVETATAFSEHFEINNSRLIFQKVAYLMKRIESQVIKKLLGSAFIDSLKADDLVGKSKELVEDYLKPGLVLLTVAKALIERVISLDNGKVAINFKGTYNNIKESIAPSNSQVKEMAEQLATDGNNFLQAGLEFIALNPEDFEVFIPQAPRRRFKFTNDVNKGVFGV